MGLAVKAVVVSTGVLSMAVMLKLSQPVILDFLTYELPLSWSFSLSWLRPPYLYLLINFIILSIVASSKLHSPAGDEDSPAESPAAGRFPGDAPVKSAVMVMEETEEEEEDVAEEVVVFGYIDDDKASLVREEIVSGGDEEKEREHVAERERDPVVVYSPVVASSAEKPPVSARFANRRSVKASPEGKAKLKVSRPKRQETLESTWRTITEGRPMPLTRHLRKSDTFSGGGGHDASPVRVMKKSDTFSSGGAWDSGSSSPASCGSSGGGKLKREASLSQDELNRRVEAFIKKFNEEMRMQSWQESLNQYREVVGHSGAH